MIPRYATLGPAPLSVRWARVVCPLVMCFLYLTLRVAPAVHDRISLGELATSGALFVGLTFLAFIALGDLIDPEPLPPRLEDTDDETGWIPAVGQLPGPAAAARELREIADAAADTEEFELLTHEYVPQHHTPARGFAVVGTVTGRIPAPAPRTAGRHRKA